MPESGNPTAQSAAGLQHAHDLGLELPEVADSAMTTARGLAPGATLIHPADSVGGDR